MVWLRQSTLVLLLALLAVKRIEGHMSRTLKQGENPDSDRAATASKGTDKKNTNEYKKNANEDKKNINGDLDTTGSNKEKTNEDKRRSPAAGVNTPATTPGTNSPAKKTDVPIAPTPKPSSLPTNVPTSKAPTPNPSRLHTVSPTPKPSKPQKVINTSKPEGNVPGTATEISASTVWDVQTSASLAFGFFPGTQVKQPSTDEVNGLMDQVSIFFSKLFQDTLDDAFIRFEATAYDIGFDDQSSLPIRISFTAHVDFTSEETAPSAEATFALMAGADFQTFIRSYAWQTEPFGATAFFQTLRVVFGEATQDPPNNASSQSNSSQEESVQRVSTQATLLFSFFPDAVTRQPTEEEVKGVTSQTQQFFTKAFANQFDDFVRFGAIVTATNFTPGHRMPVMLSLDVSAFFSMSDQSVNASIGHTSAQVFSAMEGAKLTDFIQNYVWESEPFSENIFYETMHVQVKPGGLDISPVNGEQPNSGFGLDEPDKALVYFTLSFNFHESATVGLREPGPDELDGLMNKTEEFFSHLLFMELDATGIDEIKAHATSMDYEESTESPVVVYMQLEVMFNKTSDSSNRPTAEQILAVIETANMNEYVEYYVWSSEPLGSIFFSVDKAMVEPYVPVAANTPAPSDSETISGAGSAVSEGVVPDIITTSDLAGLFPVETDVVVKFFFFEHPIRIATEDELNALTAETTMFFTIVLKQVYEDLIQLDLELVTAGFAEEINEPSVISWSVSAVFYALDGTSVTRTPEHMRNVLATSDAQLYLHKYVWNSAPLGHNIFFESSAVQFELEGDGSPQSSAVTDSVPTPAPTQTDEVVIRATMQYGFLEDIVIARRPTTAEENGILFQTTLFFNKLFRQHFSDSTFKQVTISIDHVDLVTGDDFPIVISYEFIAQFQGAQSVPESEELYDVMYAANFEEYIEFYVWSALASADSIFFDTQQVVFQAVV